MKWYEVRVNPEPWAIGPLGVGRRGGKIWAYVGRNQQLHAYQEAVKESIENPVFVDGDIHLQFYFWRQVEREHHKNYADTTNLQKATEDALQGVLFQNDRNVIHVTSVMMEQGRDVVGRVVIGIDHFRPAAVPIVPLLLEPPVEEEASSSRENSHDENAEEIF